MDRLTSGDHESGPPPLRTGPYLPIADTGSINEEAASGPESVPRISDYWPDAPHRIAPPADHYEIPSAEPIPNGRALYTQTPRASASPNSRDGTEAKPLGTPVHHPPRFRVRTGVGALLALTVVVGGGVFLSRGTIPSGARAGLTPPAQAASMAPMPAIAPVPANDPAAPRVSASSPVPSTATFELVSNTTELAVRTAGLGGLAFRVSTPRDARIRATATFTGGVLRLTVVPRGTGGSGRVDVQLSDRIVWRLRMTGGVKRVSFDLGPGTVSRIDLAGGAAKIDIDLGRQAAIVPIRMSGGVNSWRIRTQDVISARITVRRGAGTVAVNGQRRDGVARGSTIRSGNLDQGAGIDVDAVAGIGSLEIIGG